jgi:predicted HTH domain antitoxin
MDASPYVKVTVELPLEAAKLENLPVEAIAADLRLLWILDRVRTGGMSIGKGARLAGLDRWAFMRVMDEHGIPIINYAVEDLKKDLDTLRPILEAMLALGFRASSALVATVIEMARE